MLTMLQLELELRPLYTWAAQTGTDPAGLDRGYLVHSAMRIAFGAAAPQPFSVFGNGTSPRLKVLGYSSSGAEALRSGLALAEPILSQTFPAEGILEKRMPDNWTAGTELAFRVDCCPVTRCTQPDGRKREKDAFLAACDSHPGGGLEREGVYTAWAAAELARDGAAELIHCAMKQFRLFTPVRRKDGGKATRMGRRPRAALDGRLRIRDASAFSDLLARGLGRHRAFGLGMLLLRPA